GGRMTSLASAGEPLVGVRGLVFFGFPLHAPGKPGAERAEHLDRVGVPMLFLQGTKDKLASLELLTPVVERLGERATIHIVEDADHSFAMPKRSGRDLDDVLFELARTTSAWADGLAGGREDRRAL
ncbi:MAG TPA: alpha/beta family hydrolase, partial [Candidatus Eisenbacteria bacterium]|nr:alpha/beta family hydrolase [Candidatus Eisenbacteria bacterium]